MDLSRTFDQLKTKFADNITGKITEQVMRDLVESIFQYGGISLPAGDFVVNPGQTIGTTFTCVNQWVSANPSSSDVQANLIGSITINRAGVYLVIVSLSFSGSNNSDWTGSLFRNDVDLDLCTFRELLRPAGDVSSASGFDPVIVSSNDTLEYRIKSASPNDTFVLESGQFNVFRIG